IARSMFNASVNLRKNMLLNRVSRSLIIRLGIPCNRTISFINIRANSGAVIFLLHGAKWTILLYLSTKTHIALYWLLSYVTSGNDVIKSTVITCQRRVGI